MTPTNERLEPVPGSVPARNFLSGTQTGTLQGTKPGTVSWILRVLTKHQEDDMYKLTLLRLDREWADLNESHAASDDVAGWEQTQPALAGATSPAGVIALINEES